jgi:hypothetical protein
MDGSAATSFKTIQESGPVIRRTGALEPRY